MILGQCEQATPGLSQSYAPQREHIGTGGSTNETDRRKPGAKAGQLVGLRRNRHDDLNRYRLICETVEAAHEGGSFREFKQRGVVAHVGIDVVPAQGVKGNEDDTRRWRSAWRLWFAATAP